VEPDQDPSISSLEVPHKGISLFGGFLLRGFPLRRVLTKGFPFRRFFLTGFPFRGNLLREFPFGGNPNKDYRDFPLHGTS